MTHRRRFDWDAALADFLAEGTARSYGKTAVKFGVSDRAVGVVARKQGWAALADEFDRAAASRAIDVAHRTREERVRDVVRLADTVTIAALRNATRRPDDIRLSDVAPIVKLAELLEGYATDRYVEVTEVRTSLRLMVEVALEFIPVEARSRFLDVVEQQLGQVTGGSGNTDDVEGGEAA